VCPFSQKAGEATSGQRDGVWAGDPDRIKALAASGFGKRRFERGRIVQKSRSA
jgi:hypothetical protein